MSALRDATISAVLREVVDEMKERDLFNGIDDETREEIVEAFRARIGTALEGVSLGGLHGDTGTRAPIPVTRGDKVQCGCGRAMVLRPDDGATAACPACGQPYVWRFA